MMIDYVNPPFNVKVEKKRAKIIEQNYNPTFLYCLWTKNMYAEKIKDIFIMTRKLRSPAKMCV